jgi:solute carrier family 35, member F5
LLQLRENAEETDDSVFKAAHGDYRGYVRNHSNPEMSSLLKRTIELQTLNEEVNDIFAMTWKTAVLWLGCQFLYNYGLMYSSITSSMVLNNSAPMWIWLFSLSPLVPIVHRESFDMTKGMMIWLLMLGFVIISYADAHSQREVSTTGSLFGNAACLISAVFYAVYSLYMRIKIPNNKQNSFNYTYLLGFVGGFNLLVIMPVLIVLHLAGLEEFHWPSNHIWCLLLLNAFLANFIWDYCYLKSVMLLGPLITNTGLCLSFPLSLFIDVYLYDLNFTALYFLGSVFVFIAFGVIMFSDKKQMPETEPVVAVTKEVQ